MKPEPWVSLEEIARHLGVSQDTVLGSRTAVLPTAA